MANKYLREKINQCGAGGLERYEQGSYLTEELVCDEVVGRNIGLFAGVADVLLRVQQTGPDAVVTVAVPAAGDDHGVAHQVVADRTEQLVRYWVRLVLGCRLVPGNEGRSLLFALRVRLCINCRNGIFPCAGQHGSLGVRVRFDHEALGNAFAYLHWFGPLHTFIHL